MINRNMLRLFLVFLAGIILFSNLDALIFLNGVGGGGEESNSDYVANLSMEAATLFLQSNADTFMLLGEVEQYYNAYFDFSLALNYSGAAMQKLESAKLIYLHLSKIFKKAGVLPSVVVKLAAFNYLGFAEQNDLNREIMLEVSFYLASGDVLGLVVKNIENLTEIRKLYIRIEHSLIQNDRPPIQYFWSLLNRYSRATLFGNYAALVFNNI